MTTLAEPESHVTPRPSKTSLREEWRDLRGTVLLVGLVVIGAAIAVGIGLATSSSGPAGDVSVSLVNFGIKMPTSLRAGHHVFAVTNNGSVPHEFVLFRTTLPANQLPVKPDGDVNEDSPLLHDVADSGPSLATGQGRSVPVVYDANASKPRPGPLTPGHYVAVCNLPGHYRLGMRLDITVVG